MVGKRRFGRVRELPFGPVAGTLQGTGWDRPSSAAHVRLQDQRRTLAHVDRSRDHPAVTGPTRTPGVSFSASTPRDWIEERPGLRPKTIELYRYLLRRHLVPASVPGRSPKSVSPKCGAGGRISSTPGSPR